MIVRAYADVMTQLCVTRIVLGEGGVYHGVWLECAPHEGAVYSVIRPDIARKDLRLSLAMFC